MQTRKGTCNKFFYFHVSSLPQQTDQGRNPTTVLQGDFVLVVGLSINQIPQSSAGAAVNLTHPVVQQVNQQLNASLFTDLSSKETESMKFTCDFLFLNNA